MRRHAFVDAARDVLLHSHRGRSRTRDRRPGHGRPALGAALSAAGRPALRRRPDGSRPGLHRGVPAASTASAKAIWERLQPRPSIPSTAAVRRARSAKLARAGLPAPKIRTLKAIAQAIDRGELDLAALAPSRPTRRIGADRAPWHRTLDGRHLSVVLPRPCGCLAGGRPGPTGGDAFLLGFGPARRATWAARGGLAAVARRRGLHVVDLLSCRQAARGRAVQPTRYGEQWHELDGPRLEPRAGAARQLVVFLHGYGADGND